MNRFTHARRRLLLEPLESRHMLAPVNVLVNDPQYELPYYGPDVHQINPTIALAGSDVLVAYTSGDYVRASKSTDHGVSFGQGFEHGVDQPSLTYNQINGLSYIASRDIVSNSARVSISRSDYADSVTLAGVPATKYDVAAPMITVDNFNGGGNLYVIAQYFDVAYQPAHTYDGVYFYRSTDGGQTWSSRLQLGAGETAKSGWLTVGEDHSVSAFWQVTSGSYTSIVTRRSTDGGVTFGPTVIVGGQAASQVQAATNPVGGQLYVTYAEQQQGSGDDIMFTQSSDHGVTWSVPVVVNDVFDTDQTSPTIAVTPNGARVFVGFRDGRLHPGQDLTDSFAAIGAVQGNSVSFGINFRISTVSTPPVPLDPYMVDTGRVDQAIADASGFYYVWSDARNPRADGNALHQYDIFFAHIGPSGPKGPYVYAQSPEDLQVNKSVGSVTVSFSQAMDTTSFNVADDVLSFSGKGVDLKPRITGFTWLDDRSLQIRFQPQSATYTYKLILGPNILSKWGEPQDNDFSGVGGESSDATTITFSIDRLPIYRAYAAPAVQGLRLTPGTQGVYNNGQKPINLNGREFTFFEQHYVGYDLFSSLGGVLSFRRAVPAGVEPPPYANIRGLDAPIANLNVLYTFRDLTSDGKDDLLVDYQTKDGALDFQIVLELGTGDRQGLIFFNYPDLDDPAHPNQADARNATVGVNNNGVPIDSTSVFYKNGFGDVGLRSGMALVVRDDVSGLSQYRVGDTVHVFGTPNPDTVTLSYAAGQYNVLRNGVNLPIDAANISSVYLHGGGGNDQLSVQSVRAGDRIGLDGNAGDDSLVMNTAAPIAEFGGAGNDILSGGSAADALEGGPGNDTMRGYAGDDVYYFAAQASPGEVDTVSELAGKGTDRIDFSMLPAGQKAQVDLRSDNQLALQGNRTVQTASTGQAQNFENAAGGAGNDRLIGNDGPNILQGYSGDDALLGALGNDTLIGGSGSDTLTGGRGDDIYLMLPAVPGLPLERDTFVEATGEGMDTLDFSHLAVGDDLTLNLNGFPNGTLGHHLGRRLLGDAANIERVLGGAGNDTITGNDLANAIFGNGGNDVLAGGVGDDRLFGGEGLDGLDGGIGNDSLYGGTGDDRYVFAAPPGNVAQEYDTVFEFAGGGVDELDFSAQPAPMPVTVNLGQNNLATQSGRKIWAGAGTSFLDWENATGGAGDDTLIGNTQPNRLVGGPGNDTLDGGGGMDQLVQ